MREKEIKQYIINNDKLLDILESIGCHDINNKNGKFITCGLPNSDGFCSTQIFKEDYIGVNAYSKNIKFEGQTRQDDIFNIIAYCLHLKDRKSSKSWAMSFLGLENSKSAIPNDPIGFFRRAIRNKKNKNEGKQVYYDIDILNLYQNLIHIDLIKNDSLIDIKILKKYHIMFDMRTDRIIFPHFKWDDKTKICGIVGRTTNKLYDILKISKYQSMLKTRFDKTLNLYGLCFNIDSIKKRDEIIVVEAEKSVLKADMFGEDNTVAVSCHSISKEQKKIILGLNIKQIVIAFDNDVTEEEINNACDMFINYLDVYVVKDKWGFLDEKSSPLDKGYKRWKFLYNHKVKYKQAKDKE